MCEHYKYMLQIKPEFDDKFKHTGKHTQMQYLCEVDDVKKGLFKLHYDKTRFNLIVKECGKCHICRFKRASIKAAQAQCEFKSVGKGAFITLTFGTEQLEQYIKTDKRYSKLSDYKKKQYIAYLQWTLEKREFQLFIKRLRDYYYREDLAIFSYQKGYYDNIYKKNGELRKKIIKNDYYDYTDFVPRKIRFMHCGEYGSELYTHRPHHHAIIYGVDFSFDYNKVRYSKRLGRNQVVHFNRVLDKLWQFGDVTTDTVNYQACNYVARYITKKVVNKNKEYEKADISQMYYKGKLPEYCTQSNRRGLGYDYYMINAKKVNSDLHLYFKNYNGEVKSCPLPRYFKELMRKYYPKDYRRYQKLQLAKQEEFSNTPVEFLYNREIKDKEKIHKLLPKFKGMLENFNVSSAKVDYDSFELKKIILGENIDYRKNLLFKYDDFSLDDVKKERLRVELYKLFEKERKKLYRKYINDYVYEKTTNPDSSNRMLSTYLKIRDLKSFENIFKKDYAKTYDLLPYFEQWRKFYDEN